MIINNFGKTHENYDTKLNTPYENYDTNKYNLSQA